MARRAQREMRREGQVEDDWRTEGVVDLTDAVSRRIVVRAGHLFLALCQQIKVFLRS